MNTEYSHEPADWDTAVRVFDGSEKPDVTANRLRFVPILRRGESPYSDFISAGRADNCDVILKDQSVSKLHGLFWVPTTEASTWLISDARSVNGTFLNGERLAALEKVKLTPGDVIRFGDVRVRFLDAGSVFDLLSGKE